MEQRILAVLIALTAIIGLFIAPLADRQSVAVASVATGGLVPFGGRILTSTPCNEGQWIIVGPPRPGSFMFTAGSILFAWYRIYSPGPWVRGIARPVPVVCTIPCKVGKCPIGSGLQIDKVGTSLK